MSELATAVGDAQKEQKSAKLKLTMDAPAAPGAPQGGKMTGNGAIRIEDGSADTTITLSAMNRTTEMVIVDDIFYLKQPKEEAEDPAKPWLKIDPNGNDPMSKFYGLMLSQQKSSTDMSTLLRTFQDAAKITKSGTEKVNGEDATHYHVVADVQKLAKTAKDKTLRAIMELSSRQGIKQLEHDIWINADNLPMRYATQQPQGNATSKVQVDFTNWGEPVEISTPPADQIGKPPQLGPMPGGN